MTRLQAGQFNSWQAQEIFSHQIIQTISASGAHVFSYGVGTGAFSREGGGGKQRSLEAKPLAPTSAKVKNEWSHTVMSPFAFMACMGTTLSLLLVSIICSQYLCLER